MKTILALAAFAVVATPAAADFYIVQNPTTKRCTIVEQRPAPGLGVIIGGDAGFGVRVEAENRMKTIEVCRETTTGGTVIEERREERGR
jgi:hypothetical protein